MRQNISPNSGTTSSEFLNNEQFYRQNCTKGIHKPYQWYHRAQPSPIGNAKANRKTLHMTFFDLEYAFGSVHHSLIVKGLERFMFPPEVIAYVTGLYQSISGKVCNKRWTSEPFPLKKGVFQGNPLSPIIFLKAFNPIIENLNSYSEKEYALNAKILIICTPFADDFAQQTAVPIKG